MLLQLSLVLLDATVSHIKMKITNVVTRIREDAQRRDSRSVSSFPTGKYGGVTECYIHRKLGPELEPGGHQLKPPQNSVVPKLAATTELKIKLSQHFTPHS
jgi:hypothetical protein